MITMEELQRIVKSRRSMPAMELDELLHSCPEWVAQDAAREAKRAAAEMRFRAEEEPIIGDLARLGVEVGSVWDLVNANAEYAVAIPVLLDHLKRPYHDRIRNGIIRALTTKEARGLAGEVILHELRREQDSENRWALANALTVVADQGDAAAIETFLGDPAYEDVSERLGKSLRNLHKGGTAR